MSLTPRYQDCFVGFPDAGHTVAAQRSSLSNHFAFVLANGVVEFWQWLSCINAGFHFQGQYIINELMPSYKNCTYIYTVLFCKGFTGGLG